MTHTIGKNSLRTAAALAALAVLTACAEAPQVERMSASNAVDCRNEYRKARTAAERSASQSFANGTGGESASEMSRSMGSMVGYMQVEAREGRRLNACYDAVGAPAHQRRAVNDLALEGHSQGYTGNRPGTGGGAGFSNY